MKQPLFSLALGGVVFAASAPGGHPGTGAISLAVMAGFGLFVLVAGRSETIRGLRGDGRDERFAQIDLRATAVAGLVLIIADRELAGTDRPRPQRESV